MADAAFVPEKLPEVLYRYRPLRSGSDFVQDLDRARDVLERQQLWFSTFDRFNDPFEGVLSAKVTSNPEKKRTLVSRTVDPDKVLTRPERRTARLLASSEMSHSQILSRRPAALLQKVGLLCLMESGSNLLAWSHYAAGHCGIAFGFRPAKFKPYNIFSGSRAVQYRVEKPVITLGETSELGHVDAALFTKAACWEYEREWRVMSAYTPWDPDSIGRAIDNGEIKRGKALAEFVSTPAKVNAPAMFDTEDLVEVRLGALLSDEYRQLVASIVREKFPAAAVLQARLAEHLYTLNFDPAP